MQRGLWRQVKKTFGAELCRRWPCFSEAFAEPSYTCWSYAPGESLKFYLWLQAAPHENQFYVEVAWSAADFPWGAIGRKDPTKSEGRERLSAFWTKHGLVPAWDLSPEKTAWKAREKDAWRNRESIEPFDISDDELRSMSARRIPAAAGNALDAIEAFGIPLFKQVAG